MPAVTGDVHDGVEVLLPLQDWSHAEVFAYLRSVGAPISRIYEHVTNAPECARCPAWLGEKRAAYLKQHHPALAAEYRTNLHAVLREVDPVLQSLAQQLRAVEGHTP